MTSSGRPNAPIIYMATKVKAKAGGYIISLPWLKTTGYAECMGTSKLICGSAEMESLVHRLVPDKNLLYYQAH